MATARAGTKAARRCALVATALGFGVVQLDVTVVNVAMQPIGAALDGSTTALQWIVNAYTLALASLILSAGAWGDRIGAKRVFVGGFAVFTVASAACGLAPSLGLLIAARAAQGMAFLPITAAVFVGNLLAGRIVQASGVRHRRRPVRVPRQRPARPRPADVPPAVHRARARGGGTHGASAHDEERATPDRTVVTLRAFLAPHTGLVLDEHRER